MGSIRSVSAIGEDFEALDRELSLFDGKDGAGQIGVRIHSGRLRKSLWRSMMEDLSAKQVGDALVGKCIPSAMQGSVLSMKRSQCEEELYAAAEATAEVV